MGKSPDAFRTISEVADWLDTQAHVLRFWESKFTQVKPVKRAGGRRYYRPADMLLLGGIKKLLHDDGMTIKGAQKLLREKGTKYVSGLSQPLDGEEEEAVEEIELAEVTPPPIEEERGTVLSFERREEPAAEEEGEVAPEAPTQEVDTKDEGDLFSLTAPEEAPAPETETASETATAVADTSEELEDEDEPLSPEDVPSFVQRLTPKPAVTDDAPETSTEADIKAPPQETEISEEGAESNTAAEGSEDVTSPQEPGPSPLAEIATMTAIASENRAEVAALLDRLAALCERIEAAENA